jgi:catechol 2,3-dioxygenase-like lactoylglutathione lyase family enzyme
MTLKRMDNVGVVVDDLAAAVAFFKELGLELEGEAQVEGRSVDRLIGLDLSGPIVDVNIGSCEGPLMILRSAHDVVQTNRSCALNRVCSVGGGANRILFRHA